MGIFNSKKPEGGGSATLEGEVKTMGYAYVGLLKEGSSAHYPYDVTVTMEDGVTIGYNNAATPADVHRTAESVAKRYVKNLTLPYRVTGEGTV